MPYRAAGKSANINYASGLPDHKQTARPNDWKLQITAGYTFSKVSFVDRNKPDRLYQFPYGQPSMRLPYHHIQILWFFNTWFPWVDQPIVR